MRNGSRCLLIILFGCLGAVSTAQAVFELEGVYWYMTPKGHGSNGQHGEDGTRVDLEDDAGYDGGYDALGASLVAGKTHQFELSYISFDISAQHTTDREIRYSDVVFEPGDHVSSELDAALARAAYRYCFGSEDVRGGVLLGVEYADLNGKASASHEGSGEESTQVVMPVVGAFFYADPVPYLSLRIAVSGGSWEWDAISATFIDAEGSIRLLSDYGWYAGLGYRYMSLDGEDTDVPLEVDVTFSGPTIYVGFDF